MEGTVVGDSVSVAGKVHDGAQHYDSGREHYSPAEQSANDRLDALIIPSGGLR
jgi:hypothetical protein